MEKNQKTPRAEDLRLLPYSELKKMAKNYGIRSNMKAEKIITALTSRESDEMEIFSTPAVKELNSTRKTKEEKFHEDMMTPLVTPRRGTYSVGSPISLKVEDISPVSVVSGTSVLDMSNVTVSRGSERKLRPRKVSFMSPVITPRTPKNSNLKLRPKTPIASCTSLSRKGSPARQSRGSLRRSARKSFNRTPQPSISEIETSKLLNETDASVNDDVTKDMTSLPDSSILSVTLPKEDAEESIKLMNEVDTNADVAVKDTPSFPQPVADTKSSVKFIKEASDSRVTKSLVFKEETSAKKKRTATPGSSKSLVFKEAVSATKRAFSTPGSVKSLVKEETSLKIKRIATPNFKKIHQKAFDKMESIEDYHKRKLNSAKKVAPIEFKSKVTKAKSKIPGFSGIPFVPSVPASQETIKRVVKQSKPTPDKQDTENIPERRKSKFDLKASLSRKLGYKPYTGPLKPLTEASSNLNISAVHKAKEPINKVVSTNRSQNRSVLKGVRTNKRFELQMKNRRLEGK